MKIKLVAQMVSLLDRTKRALVSLLKTLAAIYGIAVNVTRDSADKDVSSAYRRVSRKAHPDHGGQPEHQTELNNAHDVWQKAKLDAKGKHGGSRKETAASSSSTVVATVMPRRRQIEKKDFRVRGTGVLLTYQKFADTGV